MNNSIKVTIPKEILAMNLIDTTKPIYIYESTNYYKYLFLSNKKKDRRCFAVITLNQTGSFELPQNIFKVIFESDLLNYVFVVLRKKIYIYRPSFSIDADRSIAIPSNILLMSKLDLNKPIYLYENDYGTGYLRNTSSSDRCYGKVEIDCENMIVLTSNMLAGLEIRSCSSIAPYARGKDIYFRTT